MNKRQTREVSWQRAAALTLIALSIQFLNVLLLDGRTQLMASAAIFIVYLAVLRTMMMRQAEKK